MTPKTMTQRFRFFLLALPIALALTALGLGAQATITQTTLSADITTTTAQTITVASATGFAANYMITVDNEAMFVSSRYSSGTTIPVSRAVSGTAAGLHASGATVHVAPPSYFSNLDPVGPCTSTNEVALPRIVVATRGVEPPGVSIYDCVGASSTTQAWQLYKRSGFPFFELGTFASPTGVATTYTSAGAVAIKPGVQFIGSSGALAMTLAAPSTTQNGMVMAIIASTAQTHTLTSTAGFNGGTTSRDVATFGGAIGDGLVVIANSGVWWVITMRNITLG